MTPPVDQPGRASGAHRAVRRARRGRLLLSLLGVVVVAGLVGWALHERGASAPPKASPASSSTATSPNAGSSQPAGGPSASSASSASSAGSASVPASTPPATSPSVPATTVSTSPTPSPTAATPSAATVDPASAPKVEVLNATRVSGLAARVADQLRDAGWRVAGTGNFEGELSTSTIYYPTGQAAAARALASALPQVRQQRPMISGLPANDLVVVIAADWDAG